MSELLWKNYEKHLDMYKTYLDLTLKLNVFHFAICGAIFSFYFANKSIEDAAYSLLLPALLSFSLVVVFTMGGFMNSVSRKDVFDIRDSLGLRASPDLLILTILLFIFAFANLVIGVAAIWVFCTNIT